jgi:SNF2 family DNA or RNA helicase
MVTWIKGTGAAHILNKAFTVAKKAGDIEQNPLNKPRRKAGTKPSARRKGTTVKTETVKTDVRKIEPVGTLYDYQNAGARFLSVAGSALMADEMGTGKTAQTIAALEKDASYPALIVAPNTVKNVWLREFAKWAPERTVVVAGSGTAAASRAAERVLAGDGDVLVVNWEALRNLSRLAPFGNIQLASCEDCDPTSQRKRHLCERQPKVLNQIPWAAVVADEAHRGKEPKAKQTRALWALGDSATRRIALTGTPIANSPTDLWSIMRFVAPDEYPAKWAWLNRYGLQVPNLFSGGVDVVGFRDDRREELDKFFLPRFIRRTKAQVLTDLPPKTYMVREVSLTGKQRKAYDDMAERMITALNNGVLTATNALTAALRLRQFASAYGELDENRVVRLSEPSSKLDELEATIEEAGAGDKPLVVFAESRQLIELASARLTKNGIESAMITGAVSAEERAENVQRFQEGKLPILLLTVGAGGEGITLTAADTAIYLQRPWSSVLNAQSEDRLHRVGQTAENVTYIDLVTVGTIEERVFELLQEKSDRLQELVQDTKMLERWLKGGDTADVE